MSRIIALALLFVASFPVNDLAASEAMPRKEAAHDGGDPRVVAELVTDHDEVDTQSFRVGVRFTMDPDWHIYWRDSGEAGVPTRVIYGGERLNFGELQWPAHQEFLDPSGLIKTYGYANETLLFADAQLPKGAAPAEGETVRVSADVDLLVCKIDCIPAKLQLTKDLTFSSVSEPSPDFPDFLAYAEQVPEDEPIVAPVIEDETVRSAPTPLETPSLPWVLLMAFLGGMILNLMPCVFPVLALKVVSFVELSSQSARTVRSHAFAYAAGITASMLVLAAVVIALRTAGTAVGWGFQFQNPYFIAVMAGVLVLFATNLFGLWEVTLTPNPSRVEGEVTLRRSAADGVLAVALSTPCSAPLLGTAVGFAFAADAWIIGLTFTAIGLGLATPFVVLVLIPAARRFLPKPGGWMAWLKRGLGLALLATAAWLGWVLSQSTGQEGVLRLAAFLAVCAVASALFGRFQFTTRRSVAAGAAVALIAVASVVALRFPEPAASERTTFDEATIGQELENGNVVFVDFTADWCITCKANEIQVLGTDEMQTLLRDQNVTFVVADWTQRDDTIHAILKRFGKAGVPMYLVYSPHRPNAPEVLPELLTHDLVEDAITRAAKP